MAVNICQYRGPISAGTSIIQTEPCVFSASINEKGNQNRSNLLLHRNYDIEDDTVALSSSYYFNVNNKKIYIGKTSMYEEDVILSTANFSFPVNLPHSFTLNISILGVE